MRKTRLRLESLDERAVPSATTPEPPPGGGTGQTPRTGSWMTVAADTPTYLGSDDSGNSYYLTGTSSGDLWVTAVDAAGRANYDLLVGTTNAGTGQRPLPPGVYPVPGPGWNGEPLARSHPSGGWGVLDPMPPGTRYARQPGWTYYRSPNGTVHGFPPGQDPYAPRPPAAPPTRRPRPRPAGHATGRAAGRAATRPDHHRPRRRVRQPRRHVQRPAAGGPDESAAESGAAGLLRSLGYQRLTGEADRTLGFLIIKAWYGKHELRLLVDTGAQVCVLDKAVAERVGIRGQTKVEQFPVLGGGATEGKLATVAGVQLGDTEMPPVQWLLTDTGSIQRAAQAQGVDYAFDGLIGQTTLRYYRAIVETDPPALNLLDPCRLEPGLQGDWQGEAVDTLTGEYARRWKLSVRGIDARLTLPDRPADDYKISLRLSAEPRQLNLIRLADLTQYSVVYRLVADTLTVAVAVRDGDDFTKRPAGIEPPAAGGYTVITYKRVKPAPAKR